MDWRQLGPSAAIALAVLGACTPTTPPTVSGFETALVRGTVVLPTQGSDTTPQAPLAEQPGTGIKLRLLSRHGQPLSALPEVLTDSSGRFAFYTTVPDGTYLAEAASGTTRRVRTFIRVKGGKSLTTLSAASTLLAQRLGREALTLSQLDQGRFDEIAAQARGMMTKSDLPDLASDEAIAKGVDTYLEGHLVIKQRLEGLITDMKALEGANPGPTPTATPGKDGTPTPNPGATFTPAPISTTVPTPVPVPEPTLGSPAQPVQPPRPLDSAPFWLAHETPDILWVSCPASGSIIRMAGSTTEFRKRYTIPASLQGSFLPGQLAIGHPSGIPATVWVANQQHDGRHVAVFDVNGNFLGAIEAGLRPAAVATDNDGRAWVGVAGEGSGQVKVYGPTGGHLKTLNVSGKPFRILSHNQTTWIATPRRLYQIDHQWAEAPGDATMYIRTLDLPGPGGALYNRNLVAMDILSISTPEVWVALQNSGERRAVLAKVSPDRMELNSAFSFETDKPIHSLIIDNFRNKWAATEDDLIRIEGENAPVTYHAGQRVLGIFPNKRGYTFWGLFDGPAQFTKLSP